MADPSDTAPAAPATPAAPAALAPEYEFRDEEEEAFRTLHTWMVRGVERARVVAGLLSLLGVAVLRRLWHVGRPGAWLAVVALAVFTAVGVILAVSVRLDRGRRPVGEVTSTRGRDVSQFMAAVRGLLGVFKALQAALVAVAALLVVALLTYLTRR